MKNQFTDAMSRKTDDDLQKIVTAQAGDYQPEGIEAAKQEIENRESVMQRLSKYTNEQILEILKSKKDYQPFLVKGAYEEAKTRNLQSNFEEVNRETAIKEEIQKLKFDLVSERCPALRFISGIYKLLAWLILIATVITLFYTQSQAHGQISIPFVIGTIVIGGILFVTMLAVAEGIKVFIDIEHNTRITATNSAK